MLDEHVEQAFESVRKGGTLVLVSIGDRTSGSALRINPTQVTLNQKRIQGSLFGQCNPVVDIPRQVDMYRAGRLALDPLVTRTYRLGEIGQACEDLEKGRNVRGVVLFDPERRETR